MREGGSRAHRAEQDVDVASALVDMQSRETTLQAALTVTGRALNLNLLDFLR